MFNTSAFNTTQFNGTGEPAIPVTEYDELITEDVDTLVTIETSSVYQLIEAISTETSSSSEYFPNAEISEDIQVILEHKGIAAAVLFDLMRVDSTLVFQIVAAIYENLLQSSVLETQGVLNKGVTEDVTIADAMLVVFPIVITNDITASVSLGDTLNRYNSITEAVSATGVFSSTAEMNSVIAAAITIAAALNLNTFTELLSEDLELSEELVELYTATENILNAINVDDLAENSVSLVVITSEDINLTTALSSNSELSNTIEEDAVFVITYKIADTIYRGYSYSPEAFSVTEYDNFNFNSSAFFNYKYIFANESGLYLLGGEMDDEAFITARIKTATMDFETSNLKQVPKVYLGVSNDASLILSVAVDGSYKAQYELQLNSNDLSTQMFNIGKGLVGRYWQFTVETKSNTSFDLDEIEIYPITFGRKR